MLCFNKYLDITPLFNRLRGSDGTEELLVP